MLIANILMAPGEGGANPAGTLFMMAGFIAIFYFLFIRPQRRQQQQHQAMVQALEKGDEVVTAGGIIGTVVHLKEDRVTIKSGETRVEVERSKIGQVRKAD
jgi:preprotein translocase subunit YajC